MQQNTGAPALDGLTHPEKVIEYIQASSAGLEKAAAQLKAYEEKQAEVKAAIPAACDACVEFARIQPGQREKFAEALLDHKKAIELLTKIAGHRNASELAAIGTGVKPGSDGMPTNGQIKQAAYDPNSSLTSPFVGRRDTRLKASDVALFRGLGMTPPSN